MAETFFATLKTDLVYTRPGRPSRHELEMPTVLDRAAGSSLDARRGA
ncbi:hypothetical protein [Micromonospora marina]